jgi:hypothetical protein
MLSKVASGEWREEQPKSENEGNAEETFEPFRDYSGNIVETQEIKYIDNATNEERARLHRYITDKGTIGGSGYPDPKRIRLADGTGYRLTRKKRNEPCAKCGRVGHEWPKKPAQ